MESLIHSIVLQGHVNVIYLTYTYKMYFRRLPFDIQIRQGQKTHLIETCYTAAKSKNLTFSISSNISIVDFFF